MSSQESSRRSPPTSSPDSYSVGLGPTLLSFSSKSDPTQSYSSSFASKQSQWSAGGAANAGEGGSGSGEWNRQQGASTSTSTTRGNTGTGWGAFSSAPGGRAAWNAVPSSADKQHDSTQSASHHTADGGSNTNGGSSSASELNGSHDYNSMLEADSTAVSHSPSASVDYSQQQNGGWDGHSHASDASSAWSANPRSAAAAAWENSSLPSTVSSHSDSSADSWKHKSASTTSAAYSRPLPTAATHAPSANSNNVPPSSYRPNDFGDVYLDPSRPTIWCYKDPQGEVQGPFDEHSMRAWYNNRFFDLKVSHTASSPPHTLTSTALRPPLTIQRPLVSVYCCCAVCASFPSSAATMSGPTPHFPSFPWVCGSCTTRKLSWISPSSSAK